VVSLSLEGLDEDGAMPTQRVLDATLRPAVALAALPSAAGLGSIGLARPAITWMRWRRRKNAGCKSRCSTHQMLRSACFQ